jgi:ligand-binding SRPBCC domain-containing protein
MAEGSISEFTLWMGPLPLRWRAVHSQVSDQGFTDTQERGPMARWRHTHRFESLDSDSTRIHEHIEYQHHPGWRGLLSRLLFGSIPLQITFAYRKWATRRALSSDTA